MSGNKYTTPSVSVADTALNGGLNSTSGPLNVDNNESSDLQNIDFSKYGSILQRNGYSVLNSTVPSLSSGTITAFADAGSGEVTVTDGTHGLSTNDVIQITGTTNYNGTFVITKVDNDNFKITATWVADDATGTWNETANSDGIHWYEYTSSGATVRKLVQVLGGKLWKMDDLDGTYDDITGALTITADNECYFSNFLNKVYVTNGEDTPFSWDGTTAATVTLPSGVTKPKYNAVFENYLFYANVTVTTLHSSRIYWSEIQDTSTWPAAHFIEIAKDDGQQITGIKVLSDRLVVYKDRSIYNVFFTGDNDIPFIVAKSNSSVGCISAGSIQELNNGHVFQSYDGLYFYDGANSYKISDRITNTLNSYNTQRFNQSKSMVQRDKNRYFLSLPGASSTESDKVIMWDYFNNAFSVYDGINAASMTTVYVGGIEERVYFADYRGHTYRADDGTNDNPLGVETAIVSYYYTNWKTWGDIVNKKANPTVTVFYQNSNSTLTFSYSYDFEDGDEYSQNFSLATSGDQYGTGVYGTSTYAGSGGNVIRRDLEGRGRVQRLKFYNGTIDEGFQIDGIGTLPHLETAQ